MSPHQIPHTEIFKSFIIWEVGNGVLQDMLRRGIGSFLVIPGPVPLASSTPPDVWIGKWLVRVEDMRRIPSRDVVIVANIVGRARRHGMSLESDGR